MFAVGYEVTGLGRRLALVLVKNLAAAPWLGLCDRPGGPDPGTFHAIGDRPQRRHALPDREEHSSDLRIVSDDNPRKIGSYLMWTAFATASVTSGMFMTSFAPNVLATEIGRKITGVQVSWGTWAMGALPVCLLLFIATPLLCYFLYPPVHKHSTEVAEWAGNELQRMGPSAGAR